LKQTLDTADILATAFELTQAKTSEAVHATLSKLASRQGFDGFLYCARFSLGSTRHTDFIMSDYDAEWRRTYDAAGYAMLDPTVAHAVSSVAPLVWSDAMYHTEAQRNFAEEARAHGIQTGVTFPVQTREGDVAMLSFTLQARAPTHAGWSRKAWSGACSSRPSRTKPCASSSSRRSCHRYASPGAKWKC
jgi:LuxR family transcriptional regulator, quorum-sensing system regulator LasR